MAVSIVDSLDQIAKRQPEDKSSLDDSAALGYQIKYKGPYSSLESEASGFSQGDGVEGDWALKSWDIQQRPGGQGVITLYCIPSSEFPSSSDNPTPYKTTYSVKSCRNDKSILAYCGDSASRENLELWMKETDTAALEQFGYRKSNGAIEPLNSVEQSIANKIKSGVESVMRFYPVITRKKYYKAFPADNFEGLSSTGNLPSDAPSINGSWDWLKCQDDLEEVGSDWIRVESWMGAPSDEGGWDADLYGSNRWPMPLT